MRKIVTVMHFEILAVILGVKSSARIGGGL